MIVKTEIEKIIKNKALFSELEKLTLEFTKLKGLSNIQENSSQITNKLVRVTQHDSKSSYKAIIIKTVYQCREDRHTGQWNKIKCTEINSCFYGQLIFDEEPTPFNGIRIDSLMNSAGTTDIHLQKNEVGPSSPITHKIN